MVRLAMRTSWNLHAFQRILRYQHFVDNLNLFIAFMYGVLNRLRIKLDQLFNATGTFPIICNRNPAQILRVMGPVSQTCTACGGRASGQNKVTFNMHFKLALFSGKVEDFTDWSTKFVAHTQTKRVFSTAIGQDQIPDEPESLVDGAEPKVLRLAKTKLQMNWNHWLIEPSRRPNTKPKWLRGRKS